MKYSIIIPTKNRAYCLWRAINSVLSQTINDFELLVVDGGSTDDTTKLVNIYEDQRIRFVINENDCGVASARNKGLKEAKGDYIGYLDSDDFVYSNWLSTIDNCVNSKPEKKLFMPNKNFSVRQVDSNGKLIKIFKEELLFEKPPTVEDIANLKIQCDTNGMIHTRSIIEIMGSWNENLKLYEDFEFLLRFVESYPDGFQFVPETLVSYSRVYGKNSLCSKAKYQDLVDNLETVYQLHRNKPMLAKQTWYPKLVDKFKEMTKNEEENGVSILDHLRKKYSK